MRILVTGAGGFIGRILAEGLYEAGECDVIGLCRSPVQDVPASGVIRINNDLTREITLADEVDYIVHCAAVHTPAGMPAKEFIEINLAMMENVLHYARRARVMGIVFTSSIDVHGEVRSGLLDERTDRINPSVYGVSKHLCELMLRDCQASVSSVSLRLCGVIGPGAKNCWMAKVLASALNGETIAIVNEGAPFNNVVHTDDILCFLRKLFAKGFSGFNAFPIASQSPLSIREVVTEMVRSAASASRIINKGLSTNSFTISNDFAMRYFNYEPAAVMENLKKYVTEMGRLRSCSEMEQYHPWK